MLFEFICDFCCKIFEIGFELYKPSKFIDKVWFAGLLGMSPGSPKGKIFYLIYGSLVNFKLIAFQIKLAMTSGKNRCSSK